MLLLLLASLTFSVLNVQPRRFPDAAEIRLINSDREWKEFAVESPPAVDFRAGSVIVVFAGERPTGGWRVRVTRIERNADACQLAYAVNGPPRDAMVTQAITHPYAVVHVRGKCTTATAASQNEAPRPRERD